MDAGQMSNGLPPHLFAIKKALDAQAQNNLMKVLESADMEKAAPVQTSTGASLTGIGQKLDIKV